MNIILAILSFTVLFRIGFNSPPPVVGSVLTGSPAQLAGIQVGDRIDTIDGRIQHDFTKIGPNIALAADGQPIQVVIQGRKEPLMVTPRRSDLDANGFLSIGIGPMPQLDGGDPIDISKSTDEEKQELAEQPVKPGERIVAINGQSVGLKDYPVLSQAVQDGKAARVTVEDAAGHREDRTVTPVFASTFAKPGLNIAGMMPRTMVFGIEKSSSAKDKLKEKDIITEIILQPNNDHIEHPSRPTLTEKLNNAGQQGLVVDLTVLRDGKSMPITGLDPSMRLGEGRKGLGIQLAYDEDHPVVADVLPDSAAASAQIPPGATIKSINGQEVQNWHDVHRLLSAAQVDQPLKVALTTESGEAKQLDLSLSKDQLESVRQNHYVPFVELHELHEPRQTKNPLIAAEWGFAETRDLMVQFYGMLRRMVQGSVPVSGAMGPIGIFHTGSKIANRGVDWLIWFLAMISANLAVVNFLPIPIVDGGLFVFLILEKIMGKPLSPRAQGIAQIVGLALIVGVFLFVTYNDISRLRG
ncbi:MAG TPA: site-2 protease family protein, partial [Tepidisphaeraceae bacterium]